MFPKDVKILIVDDMKTMRSLLQKVFKELGYENIEEADDGDIALNMLTRAHDANAPYEFVISDWHMPKMKGIELLEQVRDRWPEFPFCLLTTQISGVNLQKAKALNATAYLLKPINRPKLEAKLQKLWEYVQSKKAA